MRKTLINLVQEIGKALGLEFKPFVPELLPYLMEVLDKDDSPEKNITEKVEYFMKIIYF
jgi:hypothetical protein